MKSLVEKVKVKKVTRLALYQGWKVVSPGVRVAFPIPLGGERDLDNLASSLSALCNNITGTRGILSQLNNEVVDTLPALIVFY